MGRSDPQDKGRALGQRTTKGTSENLSGRLLLVWEMSCPGFGSRARGRPRVSEAEVGRGETDEDRTSRTVLRVQVVRDRGRTEPRHPDSSLVSLLSPLYMRRSE